MARGVARCVQARRRTPAVSAALLEPAAAAHAAELTYITDAVPGIRRRRAGESFAYQTPTGRPLRDAATLARIRKLAIPPAWTDVWICPDPDCHLQATGRDARGRKQYRYHPRWREVRDETKYNRMVAFGHALPRIRARVARDLARPGVTRERVLATIVRLLETTLIRVGNEEYARANKSFGLTTLRTRHVDVRGAIIAFRFRGKGGKDHQIRISDRRLAAIVKRIRDLPGQEMFQFVNDEGRRQAVSSGDVNAYLREAAGQDFTAKDFRTWYGTLIAARGLDDPQQEPRGINDVVAQVAEQLGNTVAIAKKCYIHPLVLESWRNPALRRRWPRRARVSRVNGRGLSHEERALLSFLEHPPAISLVDALSKPVRRRRDRAARSGAARASAKRA